MTKINHLINIWPKGTVKTVKELHELGYSPQLLKSYANSNWIELVSKGIYKLSGDEFIMARFVVWNAKKKRFKSTCRCENRIDLERICSIYKAR